MASDDQNTVIVRMMDNGHIRSHLREVENLQITSGIYYTLYGDSKRIDEKTGRMIDLQKSGLLKQYKTIRIFVFNTAPFDFNIDFEADSRSFHRISGRVKCTASLNKRRIKEAESLDLRNVTRDYKEFCRSDFSRTVSQNIVDAVKETVQTLDAKDISNDPGIIMDNCNLPESVIKWTSSHGFSISIAEITVTNNEIVNEKREELKAKKDREKVEQQLEDERKKTELNIARAKNEIDQSTGETKDAIAFKRIYSKEVTHGVLDSNGEILDSDLCTVSRRPDGFSMVHFKKTSPTTIIPSALKTYDGVLDITHIGPKVFEKESKNISEIVIEDGVLYIENNAFQNCTSVKSIKLPDSLRSVGASVFNNCASLRSISIPDNTEHIDRDAFLGCRLSKLSIPSSLDISDIKLPSTTSIERR